MSPFHIGSYLGGPHVGHVAVGGDELVQPRLGLLCAAVRLLLVDGSEGGAHARLHLAGVPTDVDNGALLEQRPHLIPARRDVVLHVALRLPVEPRKRARERGDPLTCERLQLLLVNVILLRVPTAEEEQRGPDRLTLRLERRPLLQEPAERRQARPGPDENHADARVVGGPEGRAGGAHHAGDGAAGGLLRQVRRAHSTVAALPRACRRIHDGDGDAARVGLHQRRRRDRVVAWTQRRQQLQIDVEGQPTGRDLLQQVEQRPVWSDHLGLVARAALLVIAGQAQQLLLVRWTVDVLRQDLDLGPPGDLLHLDVLREQVADGDRVIERQERFTGRVAPDTDEGARRQVEARGDA